MMEFKLVAFGDDFGIVLALGYSEWSEEFDEAFERIMNEYQHKGEVDAGEWTVTVYTN